MNQLIFKECENCSKKVGAITLCEACLFNRTLICDLVSDLRFYKAIIQKIVGLKP